MPEQTDDKTPKAEITEGTKKEETPETDSTKKKEPYEKPKVLLNWESPAREYSNKTASYFTALAVLTVLLAALFFIKGESVVALAILAIGFVLFALNRYEPPLTHYELLNTGLTIQGRDFIWDQFESFYIEEKDSYSLLYIQTWLDIPNLIVIIIPKDKQQQIETELLKHLRYVKIKTNNTLRYIDETISALPFDPDRPIPRFIRSLLKRTSSSDEQEE